MITSIRPLSVVSPQGRTTGFTQVFTILTRTELDLSQIPSGAGGCLAPPSLTRLLRNSANHPWYKAFSEIFSLLKDADLGIKIIVLVLDKRQTAESFMANGS